MRQNCIIFTCLNYVHQLNDKFYVHFRHKVWIIAYIWSLYQPFRQPFIYTVICTWFSHNYAKFANTRFFFNFSKSKYSGKCTPAFEKKERPYTFQNVSKLNHILQNNELAFTAALLRAKWIDNIWYRRYRDINSYVLKSWFVSQTAAMVRCSP